MHRMTTYPLVPPDRSVLTCLLLHFLALRPRISRRRYNSSSHLPSSKRSAAVQFGDSREYLGSLARLAKRQRAVEAHVSMWIHTEADSVKLITKLVGQIGFGSSCFTTGFLISSLRLIAAVPDSATSAQSAINAFAWVASIIAFVCLEFLLRSLSRKKIKADGHTPAHLDAKPIYDRLQAFYTRHLHILTEAYPKLHPKEEN